MKGYKDWINTHSGEQDPKALERLWKTTAAYKSGYSPNVDEGHVLFMDKIKNGGDNGAKVVPFGRRRAMLRVAAAIVVLLAAGFVFKQFFTNAGALETIATNEAEKKNMNLADGTLVTLNGLSKLAFPAEFDETERRVKLEGEGYFEVARDEAHPFVVETKEALVRVLGTSFNVRSFDDEKMLEVFVNSGKVAVVLKELDKKIELAKGDLLTYNEETGEHEVVSDEEQNTLAWKNGKLRFNKQPMSKIFSALEKLYHIEITAENEDLSKCLFTFNTDAIGLEEVIESLKLGCKIEFTEVSSGKYKVAGSCCE